MNNKRTRNIIRIFTIDRIEQGPTLGGLDGIYDFEEQVREQEKHYGLKLVSESEEILIVMEYSNIIWNYKIYFGSYKKKFKVLSRNDERWEVIEKDIVEDLKIMGLEKFKNKILTCLKDKKHFESRNKSEEQFKRYFIKD